MTPSVPKNVDYHCHLDLYPHFERQFAACALTNLVTFAVTTTPRAWPNNKAIGGSFSNIRVGLGLHPQLVGTRSHELSLFEKYFQETHFIGEIGLDASPAHRSSFDEQKRVFHHILRLCAEAGDRVASIHSVRAAREVLDSIEMLLAGSGSQVVLHWFTGSLADVRRAVELGCYFSFNEQMLSAWSSQRITQQIPPDRILTETDGPFALRYGRPANPGQVAGAVQILAKLWRQSAEITSNMIVRNVRALEAAAPKFPKSTYEANHPTVRSNPLFAKSICNSGISKALPLE
jgi:TatD DNase family protein